MCDNERLLFKLIVPGKDVETRVIHFVNIVFSNMKKGYDFYKEKFAKTSFIADERGKIYS